MRQRSELAEVVLRRSKRRMLPKKIYGFLDSPKAQMHIFDNIPDVR